MTRGANRAAAEGTATRAATELAVASSAARWLATEADSAPSADRAAVPTGSLAAAGGVMPRVPVRGAAVVAEARTAGARTAATSATANDAQLRRMSWSDWPR